MNRFHVHIAVENLERSIEFYSRLFGRPPVKQKQDYAKWMLEDPRVNFAISSRGHSSGLNHFGIQVESQEDLDIIKENAERASEGNVIEQGETACCYSNSEKHWTIDPEGIAWEHFVTMSDSVEFGDDNVSDSACCIPLRSIDTEAQYGEAACCVQNDGKVTGGSCCA